MEIAKRVGVKQATISNFENAPDNCQLQTLFKIMQALKVNMWIQLPENESSSYVAESAHKKGIEDW